MCAIFGVYNLDNKKEFDIPLIQDALSTMNYRGPDAYGIKTFENKAVLGHLRLSIIDLNEESNQPLPRDDRYWITFNGEIYNYIEIRDELTSYGYTFKTQSDTEVLLAAYQRWGEDCVQYFNGMWAFAIYDKEENKLFCSRDRFGIKPFNYATVDGQFIFSSEIKAIIQCFPSLKVPNYNVIANYCRTSIGAQTRETWFNDIYRLAPAHNLTIDSTGVRMHQYWDYPKKVNRQITFDDAKDEYRRLLRDSLSLRMRSDVPVGFTLSSGIDSTSLVCLLKDHFEGNKNTYTASFSKNSFSDNEKKQNFKTSIEIDEPSLVKKLTKELNLTPNIVTINYDQYVDGLRKIIIHLESGHGSPAVFPLDQVLQRATEDVTVVLEGQGADELLGGYISNVMPVYFIELIKKFRIKQAFAELKSFAKVYSLSTAFKLFIRQLNITFINKLFFLFYKKESFYAGQLKKYKPIQDFPVEPTGFDTLLNRHLYKAHTGGLVNLLHYGDAISMRHSLESRLPFMDYRLVEYVFTLPSEYKVHNGVGKYLHRKSMEGIVPDYIINNPVKLGFDSPLSDIFSKTDENSPRAVLLSEKCINRGLFSKPALTRAFDEQKQKVKDHSRVLYRLLNVELWFREFIDK